MPRPKSNPVSVYSDITPYLDTVLRHEQDAVIKFDTEAECHTWRSRAHRYRVALRRLEESEMGLAPGRGSCKYDDLILRVEGTTVVIAQRTAKGKLEIDGVEMEPVADELLTDIDMEGFDG